MENQVTRAEELCQFRPVDGGAGKVPHHGGEKKKKLMKRKLNAKAALKREDTFSSHFIASAKPCF